MSHPASGAHGHTHHKETPKDGATRRDFIVLAATALGGVGACATAWPFINSMNPSADVLALSSIEQDITQIQPGMSIKVMWRGAPVFVRRRTPAELKAAQDVNVSDLRDPQTDAERTKKGHEEWLIVVGICTHLGCVPLVNQGSYGGWFCPCHGSVYDTSGRIRSGPAPKNLVVPPYTFETDTMIKIG